MRFKKIIGLIVGVVMLFSIALVGCDSANLNGNNNDGNNTDEEITVAAIDKENIYTWFDMNKRDLPNLEKCKKNQGGYELKSSNRRDRKTAKRYRLRRGVVSI